MKLQLAATLSSEEMNRFNDEINKLTVSNENIMFIRNLSVTKETVSLPGDAPKWAIDKFTSMLNSIKD